MNVGKIGNVRSVLRRNNKENGIKERKGMKNMIKNLISYIFICISLIGCDNQIINPVE